MTKTLIVFFSHAGENYGAFGIENLKVGNTCVAAQKLSAIINASAEEIIAKQEYPHVYSQCTELAKKELKSSARPALANDPDPSDYDVIYLGYPNWWGTMPMPLWTWLEAHDFTGKTVYPFCTNEGSSMGSSEQDLKKLVPNADVQKGLAVYGHDAGHCEEALNNWVLNHDHQ